MTYLAAFIAAPGQCLLDVEPPAVARRYRELAASEGDGWRVPASPAFLDQWGITDPGLRSLVGPRLTDFPLRCTTDPVEFDPAALDQVRRAYINHTRPPLPSLGRRSSTRWRRAGRRIELPFGHDLMLAAPGETAALLDAMARRPGDGLAGIARSDNSKKRVRWFSSRRRDHHRPGRGPTR